MMTLSNGDIFPVTSPLWGESTGHRCFFIDRHPLRPTPPPPPHPNTHAYALPPDHPGSKYQYIFLSVEQTTMARGE